MAGMTKTERKRRVRAARSRKRAVQFGVIASAVLGLSGYLLWREGKSIHARETGGFGVTARWSLAARISAVALGLLTGLALIAYLTLYNVLFVSPLGVILVAASVRPTLNRLARWNLHHREGMRLGVCSLGLIILATV